MIYYVFRTQSIYLYVDFLNINKKGAFTIFVVRVHSRYEIQEISIMFATMNNQL